MFLNYFNWITRHHRLVVFLSIIATLSLGFGAARLDFSNDFRIYFSADNPQLAALEDMEETFGKQDAVHFYIKAIEGDLFTREHLSLIHELTQAGWRLPYVSRVNSLTNYQHTEARGDDLYTDYLLAGTEGLNAELIARIKRIALGEPALVNSVIARDGKATGVMVRLRLPPEHKQAGDEAVHAARELLASMREKYPDAYIGLAGSTTAGVTLGEAVRQDMGDLAALSYAIIITGLLLLLRSVRGMLLTILLASFAIVATMGIYGWTQHTLTPVAGWVPTAVTTIAVADSVHILISYFHGLRNGLSRQVALWESMRINANPVLITSLTTIIGVLCLNFSDSPPYRDLGNMIAVGVLYAYLLSMSFLPAALAWFDIGKTHVNKGEVRWMGGLANWIIHHQKPLLVGMGAWVLIAVAFIPRNELTERWHEYFDETFEQRRVVEDMNASLSGVHAIRYIFDSGEDSGIHEPAYLRTLEDFGNWYRKQDGVVYVHSLADIQKRLHKTMHGDEQAWYRVPERRDLAAQYFLLYEIGLPRELNMDTLVSFDRSKSLFHVVISKTDSESILELDSKAHAWLQENAAHLVVSEGTGMDIVFGYINRRNINQVLQGILLALVLISFVLVFALRSVRLGMISLIPNLVPAALAYGTWGLFIGRVDLSASIVICMSLGIVVDDTVHFLSKYLHARREKNMPIEAGMRYAFDTVGVALTITTVVLVAGFSALLTSHFSPTWVAGLLLAMTLSYALIADFFFLPPLLMSLDRRGYTK